MISVVIPTYRKVEQLVKNLETNLPFLEGCEVIIVNDYPQESIKDALGDFKKIKLIENKKNLGFAGAVHEGISQTTGKYILLLNSDVILIDASFHKAVIQFEQNKKLFAVSFCQKEKNGVYVGKNQIYWEKGFFQHRKAPDLESGINGWAEGGSCLIDREKYMEIGGFDTLYSPFYWEDIDLSYRAWKSGYEIYFDRAIEVIHHHESTIGTYFDRNRIYKTVYRNQFVFIWKNINDNKLIWSHIGWTMRLLPGMCFKEVPFVIGFWNALSFILKIVNKRKNYKKTDLEILGLFHSHI